MSNGRITFDFTPADTLFCRDARPLAAGSGYGHGANWPLPTILHSAIRTALLREAEAMPTQKQPGYLRNGQPKGAFGTEAFNWLNVHGPFPIDPHGIPHFPIPLDLVPANGQPSNGDRHATAVPLAVVPNTDRHNDLPQPLTHVLSNPATPSKHHLPQWVPASFYQAYLSLAPNLPKLEPLALWDSEHRIGVEIDDQTGTAADGQLYAAEHLRLRPDVKLRFSCGSAPSHKGPQAAERGKDLTHLEGRALQLGGEQRFGAIARADSDLTLPSTPITGTRVKWVLLTPAIFSRGWLPGWIDPQDGSVKLRTVDRARRADFRRRRREGTDGHDAGKDPIRARLVAARIGKPQTIGGWQLLPPNGDGTKPGPKATQLAVPSGSVFYFEAEDESEAKKLAAALQGRCRSDAFGEKGLGLGVCGIWKPTPTTHPTPQE